MEMYFLISQQAEVARGWCWFFC